MTNGDEAAFSIAGEALGLTKREYFASMALCGLSVQAIPGVHNSNAPGWNSESAKHAVALADALILELNSGVAL